MIQLIQLMMQLKELKYGIYIIKVLFKYIIIIIKQFYLNIYVKPYYNNICSIWIFIGAYVTVFSAALADKRDNTKYNQENTKQ